MSQTILIEPNQDLRKIFSLNLTTFVGTDVIHRKNANDTIELLRILPQVGLVITRAKIGKEETGLMIYHFIKSQNLTTALIILGHNETISSEVLCLEDSVEWEILIRQAAQHLGVNLQDSTAKTTSDYLPVGVHYFYEIKQSPCDIYIRIKKSSSEYQYIKRIHSKDVFDKNDIQKYEDQGLKEFYVQKDYIQYFTTYVTNYLIKKLEREDLTMEERILATANAHVIVRESIQAIGFDDASIELSEASINSMIKSLNLSPQVVELLKFLFSNKVSYAYQHCHMLALICHFVLIKQSWYKPEHLVTLSFVSFFSDVTLKINHQMQISSMKELDGSNLTEEEKSQVMTHAKDAVGLLANHPDVTDYIKTVILQSHGCDDGLGFEENPSEELHPLSKVFIVADAFVKMILNPNMPSSKKTVLSLLSERFTNPSYQKIIRALEKKFQ